MAQEQQRFREERSPYVADSGGVGHLGQPTSMESDRPSQAPGDRGVHFGGKETGAYGDTQNVESGTPQQHHHPLEATHDHNIGHGHEPFSSSGYVAPAGADTAAGVGEHDQRHRGMGEEMKDAARGMKDVVGGHREKYPQKDSQQGFRDESGVGYTPDPQQQQQQQQPKSPGIIGKMKDAVTGQKPGYGTGSGYATSGGAVPGEEDYAGNFQDQGMQQQQGHDSNWPRPVPPPGMSKPSAPTDDSKEPGHTPGLGRDAHSGAKSEYASGDPKVGTGHDTYSGDKHGYTTGDSVGTGRDSYSGDKTGYSTGDPNIGAGHGDKSGYGAGRDAYSGDKPGYSPGDNVGAGRDAYSGDKSGYTTGDPNAGAGRDDRARYDPEQQPGTGGLMGTTYNTGEKHGAGAEPKHESYTGQGFDQPGAGGYNRDEQPGMKNQYAGQEFDKPGTGTGTGGGSAYTSDEAGGRMHGRTPLKTDNQEQDKEEYEHFSTPGAVSTPPAPNARHDTPTAGNDAGAEYKDSHGEFHKEGPRDDNVKKEGLMAKMMDKLHLGPSHKNKTAP